jgi:arsenite methyltransferase
MAAADGNRLLKKSVVAIYETETFGSFLKDILHPGGLELTRRVGEVAQLDEVCTVLDIACGKAESIFLLAKEYGCRAIGIDLSQGKIAGAAASTRERNVSNGVYFLVSDAEELPFNDASFDVVLSECSFSVLPSKEKAASEIARVLKPGGRFVMTDIVLGTGRTSGVSNGLTADTDLTLPCIAGAQSVAGYIEIFEASGLCDAYVEDHSKELKKIGYQMAMTFGGWKEFLQVLSSELCHASFGKQEAGGLCCVEPSRKVFAAGRLGYTLIRVTKP